MCFFSHKCWVRQVCTLAGCTTLLIPVVAKLRYQVVPNRCFSCSTSLFSRLMDKAGFSQSICTMSWGCGAPELCGTWLLTSFCPCRPDLSLSQGIGTSELGGDGGPQGKSSPLDSPQSSCPYHHSWISRGNFGSFGNSREKAAPSELLVPQDGATPLSEVGWCHWGLTASKWAQGKPWPHHLH